MTFAPHATLAGDAFSYSGTELDAMAHATNYYGWIMQRFRPHLGRRIVEVGAGIGTVADRILRETSVDQLTLIEPAVNNVPFLRRRFEQVPAVDVVSGYLEDVVDRVRGDTFIAVNVLEHVEHDAKFLRAAYDVLRPGGKLLIAVPAVQGVYGSLDRAFEHYRRYSKKLLADRVRASGFLIRDIRYMNSVGLIGWFVTGRVVKRKTIGAREVKIYDRFVVPWLSAVERVLIPPIGQSLLLIGEKPM